MGTWGDGPFDSDSAADYASAVRAAPDTTARRTVLLDPMRTLLDAGLSTLNLDRYEDYQLDSMVLEAVAAVAFVADSNLGRSHHTDNAFARGVSDTGPITILPLVELPEVDDELRATSLATLEQVVALLRPDDSADPYRAVLAELTGHLAAPAPQEGTA